MNQYLEEKSVQHDRVHLVNGLGGYCGMDKIHYSIFKSHLAWSRVADAILLRLGVTSAGSVGLGSMATSLCENLNRLITSDMLRVKKKPKGFF